MKQQDMELVNFGGCIWQEHGPRLPVAVLSAPRFFPVSFLSIHGKVQNTRSTTMVQARRSDPCPTTPSAPPVSHDFH
jgi:hypothetical protein